MIGYPPCNSFFPWKSPCSPKKGGVIFQLPSIFRCKKLCWNSGSRVHSRKYRQMGSKNPGEELLSSKTQSPRSNRNLSPVLNRKRIFKSYVFSLLVTGVFSFEEKPFFFDTEHGAGKNLYNWFQAQQLQLNCHLHTTICWYHLKLL